MSLAAWHVPGQSLGKQIEGTMKQEKCKALQLEVVRRITAGIFLAR